jgi:hypothetical protein
MYALLNGFNLLQHKDIGNIVLRNNKIDSRK